MSERKLNEIFGEPVSCEDAMGGTLKALTYHDIKILDRPANVRFYVYTNSDELCLLHAKFSAQDVQTCLQVQDSFERAIRTQFSAMSFALKSHVPDNGIMFWIGDYIYYYIHFEYDLVTNTYTVNISCAFKEGERYHSLVP